MLAESPTRSFTCRVGHGSTQIITAVVIVLIAVVGVLIFVNPAPKSALTSQQTTPAANSQPDATKPPRDAGNSSDEPSEPAKIPQETEPAPINPIPMSGPPKLDGAPNSNTNTQRAVVECPLEFEPAEFDYGYVLVGQTTVKEVVVFNPSNQTINVTDLLTACPCTEAEINPRAIGPGEAAVLTLSYTAQSFPHVPGKRSVRLQTSEYPQHSPGVTFDAAVGREIRVNADRDPIIQTRSGEIRLDSYDGEPFRVLLVDGREPDFVDFDPSTDEPRNSYLVNYDLSVRSDDSFPRHLHILTDRASDPMTEILTFASPNFRETLTAQPAYWMAENRIVQVGTLSLSKPEVTRRVTLLRMPPGSEESELTVGVRPATGRSLIGDQSGRGPDAAPAVEARIVSVEPDPSKARNRFVTVEFTLTPGMEPGLYHDIMSFILEDGSYTELDVATYVTEAE